MNFERSRVIIGFKKNQNDLDKHASFASAEAMAWHILNHPKYPILPGMIRVIRRLKHLNAIVLLIQEDRFDEFRLASSNYDPIEYCDLNYFLRTADITDSVAKAYRKGVPLGRILRSHHLNANADENTLGAGARIAFIDSGISPHPYLPALSASELKTRMASMHWQIPNPERTTLYRSLASAEQTMGGAAIGTVARATTVSGSAVPPTPLGPSEWPDLAAAANRVAERYAEDSWTAWEVAMARWISNGRKDTRPTIPCFRNIFGLARLVSPMSRSFLEDELSGGILDVMGHGTQMVGMVSALNPNLDFTDPQNLPLPRQDTALGFQPDFCGAAPYAELLILKCCHDIDLQSRKSLDGCMLYVIDALAYLLDIGAHVAYIGFAIHDCDPKTVNAISGLLSQLETSGCVIAAPVGNDVTKHGLGFPAASSSARAIAALTHDPNQPGLIRADYSAVADRTYREIVAFAAFGGDENHQILTTSLDYGYCSVSGSSVAAAIAAGIYASEVGSWYIGMYQAEYNIFVSRSGAIDVPKVRSNLAAWQPSTRSVKTIDAALSAKVGICRDSATPDADIKVGAGVLRI